MLLECYQVMLQLNRGR